MADQQNGAAIEPLDTTKDGIKAYLEEAGKTLKAPPQSAAAMRLAVVRFLLDSAKIHDPALRGAIWKQFSATPAWFGTNNSAGRQALGIKSVEAEVLSEYTV